MSVMVVQTGDRPKRPSSIPAHAPGVANCCTKVPCNVLQLIGFVINVTSLDINELQQPQDDESKQGQLFSILHMKGLGSVPIIEVSVRGSNGDATLNVLPHSGADITAARAHILMQLGEHIGNLLPSTHKTTYSVNGSSL